MAAAAAIFDGSGMEAVRSCRRRDFYTLRLFGICLDVFNCA